jgi:hypothetical protein
VAREEEGAGAAGIVAEVASVVVFMAEVASVVVVRHVADPLPEDHPVRCRADRPVEIRAVLLLLVGRLLTDRRYDRPPGAVAIADHPVALRRNGR